MKRIFLVRHAKSSWAEPHVADDKRPLNERGKRDAPFMAEILSTRYADMDLIFSSPAKRAHATAKKFAKAYQISKKDIILKEELYLSGASAVSHVVQGIQDDTVENIAIFGHNPGWTYIVNSIPDVRIDNVPTCGVAIIESAVDSWSDFSFDTAALIDFLYPKKFNLE